MENGTPFEKIKAAFPEFDYEAAMKTCMGDEEFYMELLQDFSKLPIKEELEKYFSVSDEKNYCIRIHGFKNNSYSIGARALGNLAYELEKITKQGSFEGIESMQKELLDEYNRICTTYREVIENI